ncbi:hypothetical protein D1610_02155 [Sphingomonas gilva]|uniref:Uncharacterized protein n=1 Tax=Sphingomonas gilva TaxID=2305907 RepID=A0A396RYZ4_9SPHN|nr:hypothetical protein [Sphingomonas gilva]RHW18961.1 hypothetical protein D1610_02155 [Sphingomonas gilva]
MPPAESLEALIGDLRSIGEPDRRAILRRLTMGERARIEHLLRLSPPTGGMNLYSDALVERIAAASSDSEPSNMTAATRETLLGVMAGRSEGAWEPAVRRGGSLLDVIGGAVRKRLSA